MAYPLQDTIDEIKTSLQPHLPKKTRDIHLETPPDKNMGDFAFPCFPLASLLKKSPQAIAKELVKKIQPPKSVTRIDTLGGYVNFFLNNETLLDATLNSIMSKKGSYGYLPSKKRRLS